MAFFGEGISVEGNERIFGARALEGVIKSEESGEIFRVCDESSPY